MARLSERLLRSRDAVVRLREALDQPASSTINRDAAIFRFTTAYEALWKAARAALIEREGFDEMRTGSPRATIRASRMAGFLTDEEAEAALAMTNDRNVVVHAYTDPLADALHQRLPAYADLMQRWLDRCGASPPTDLIP